MIAIYARATHLPNTDWNGHGYSVIAVRVKSHTQAEDIQRTLNTGTGLPEPFGHTYKWYGGPGWDYLFTLPGNDNPRRMYRAAEFLGSGSGFKSLGWKPAEGQGDRPMRWSLGDARFIGFYDAAELQAESAK